MSMARCFYDCSIENAESNTRIVEAGVGRVMSADVGFWVFIA